MLAYTIYKYIFKRYYSPHFRQPTLLLSIQFNELSFNVEAWLFV